MIKLTRKQEALYSNLLGKLLEIPMKEFSVAVEALESCLTGVSISTKKRMDIVMSMFLKEAFALYVAHCLDIDKPATAEEYRIMVDNAADELKDFFNDPEMTASYVENSRDQAI